MNETVDPAKTRVAEPTSAPMPPVAPTRRRRRWPRILVALLLALVAFVAFERWEKLAPGTVDASKTQEKAGPPQTIRAANAERGDMPITIEALGTVTPLATVTVKTQISGRLMNFGFQEGPARQGRRFHRPNRFAPLRGRARAGAGATRQGHGDL